MAKSISISLKIEGMDDLLRKMNKVEGGKYMLPALKAGGERVRDQAGKYPPSTSANDPSQSRWYERNYGPKWRTADGSVKGKKTSQSLGKKWYVKPSKDDVTVGNTATYAPYVHGDKLQAKWMGKIGWKLLGKTALDQADEILKDIEAAFFQMWDRG